MKYFEIFLKNIEGNIVCIIFQKYIFQKIQIINSLKLLNCIDKHIHL